MKFVIEQLALFPKNPEAARRLLAKMGMVTWTEDVVTAAGTVRGHPALNTARLAFNYEAGAGQLELEVLQYVDGDHWMQKVGDKSSVSHLGMHCTEQELQQWREFFSAEGIGVAQEVFTTFHTNPAIAGTRRYHYVIFDTRAILGVDLKFIVRMTDDSDL